MGKVIAIVQARLSSTRLPRKVLRPLLSKPLLAHVIDRLHQAKLIDQVVVATTKEKDDDELVSWCEQNNHQFFRGSLDNVLSRFYHCATEFEANHIVRVTSDNPLADPEIIDQTIQYYFDTKADYCANNLVKKFPHGLDVEVFSYAGLKEAHENATEDFEKEHVTQYIRHRKDKYKISSYEASGEYNDIRITCDEDQDYQLIKIIMKILGEDAKSDEVIQLFRELPALKKINEDALKNHKTQNDKQGIV